MPPRYRIPDFLAALHAFGRASGIAVSQSTGGQISPGLSFEKADFLKGSMILIERSESGHIRFPLGINKRTSISAMEHATQYARAFALAPKIFGERETVYVDSAEKRRELVAAIDEIGRLCTSALRRHGLNNPEITELIAPRLAFLRKELSRSQEDSHGTEPTAEQSGESTATATE